MSSAVQRGSDIKKRRVSVDEMHLATSLCCATIYAIIHKDLQMKQDCPLRFSRDLKTEQNERRVQNCQKMLPFHNKDPEGFFAILVAGD
jgi:hypothetical protein